MNPETIQELRRQEVDKREADRRRIFDWLSTHSMIDAVDRILDMEDQLEAQDRYIWELQGADTSALDEGV